MPECNLHSKCSNRTTPSYFLGVNLVYKLFNYTKLLQIPVGIVCPHTVCITNTTGVICVLTADGRPTAHIEAQIICARIGDSICTRVISHGAAQVVYSIRSCRCFVGPGFSYSQKKSRDSFPKRVITRKDNLIRELRKGTSRSGREL